VNGYYDSLLRFLDSATEHQLLRAENRELVLTAPDANRLLDRMQAYAAPAVTKWIDTTRT
jgi:predicted Rossmann-fold nucleotide-binding protein